MPSFVWGLILGGVLGGAIALSVARYLDPPVPPSLANDFGTFPTSPRTEWLADGRHMRLLEDFVYIDPRKQAWVAPVNTEVDGASIPRPLWSIVGGPFEGQYRNASIVHDVECVRRSRPAHEVHYMFYEACRCGGLPEDKAKLLYAAVYHYGPQWIYEVRTLAADPARPPTTNWSPSPNWTLPPDFPIAPLNTGGPIGSGGPPDPSGAPAAEVIAVPLTTTPLDEAALQKLQQYIEANNPSVESIPALNPNAL